MINLVTKIAKTKLIAIVQENKAKHIAAYKEALDIYKKDYTNKLLDFADDAAKDIYHSHIGLSKPIEYTKEYDSALRMLELTDEKVISLEPNLFQCLVEDSWLWKNNFNDTTMLYLNKK